MNNLIIKTLGIIVSLSTLSLAGIYSGPANDPANAYDAAISKNDAAIVSWANSVINYSPAPGVSTSYQNPTTGYGCLGDLSATQIAEGVSVGSIVVGFEHGITNGDGADFAVFENGFAFGVNSLFMELAYVQVSSDGLNFIQFDAISTNTAPTTGSGSFSGWDTTNVYNLAGKHQSGWGTPFDLDELVNNTLVLNGTVDLGNINYVKLIDIPGTGDFLDSLGNPILDNHLTTGSGGFDFRLSEGVAVINEVPEPATLALLGLGGLFVSRKRKQ